MVERICERSVLHREWEWKSYGWREWWINGKRWSDWHGKIRDEDGEMGTRLSERNRELIPETRWSIMKRLGLRYSTIYSNHLQQTSSWWPPLPDRYDQLFIQTKMKVSRTEWLLLKIAQCYGIHVVQQMHYRSTDRPVEFEPKHSRTSWAQSDQKTRCCYS